MNGFDDRNLVIIVGAPRAGTTLLMRLLSAHTQVRGAPEPHVLTPLAHLGLYARVDKAPYDPIQTARGQRALVDALPGGDADYVAALRACTDTLYGALADGAPRVVDKTPANALCLPFITRLYPRATYVVLTRHPFAIWCSYARSFFDDDWEVALAHNPILARYVPAIATFLRRDDVPHRVHLTYEALIADPHATLTRVCAALGVPFEPAMVQYGDAEAPAPGLGDPTTVDGESRPIDASVHRWAAEVRDDPVHRAALERMLRSVSDEDLAAWGFPRQALWTPLDAAIARPGARKWSRHRLERAALVTARRNVHHGPLGRALRQARFALDVLLRD